MSAFDLRLGDCLDPVTGLASLADQSVDHAIFDAPYSEHVHAKSRRGVTAHDAEVRPGLKVSRAREFGFDALPDTSLTAVAQHMGRVVRRWVLSFCDAESVHRWSVGLTKAGLDVVRIGAWIKVGGAPQFSGDRLGVGFEAIVIAHVPGRKRWNGGGRPGIWSCPIVLERGGSQQEERIHTAQKPLALMEALTRDFTDAGELILDPFAGSGTTGVACLRSGRRFVGWERNPEWHAAAVKRLAATREQPELWRPADLMQRRAKTLAFDFGSDPEAA